MANVFGTDNDEDLIGTAGADVLYALAGKDRLYAKAGNDTLYGGDGNDLLDGMEGADVMYGGAGNDSYRVDSVGDVVNEDQITGIDDGGVDLVTSWISYSLGAFLENLTLSGAETIDGTGNGLANKIKGNDAANVLDGGAGNDTISGGAGDDLLIGGIGADTLDGGLGSDTFGFADASSGLDRISDFGASDFLGVVESGFGLGLGAGIVIDGGGRRSLDPTYFATISGSKNLQGTATGHGQFLYNTTTRQVLWDSDGSGTQAGIALATLNAGATLTAAQFALIGDLSAAPLRVSVADAAVVTEGSGARLAFKISLSAVPSEDVVVTYSTVAGTATSGADFAALVGAQATIAAGTTWTTVYVDLLDDTLLEQIETLSLQIDSAVTAITGTNVALSRSLATGSIEDDETPAPPAIVQIIDTRPIGSTDPSGLAWISSTGRFMLSDSEVEESPFNRSDNLFQLQPDGTLVTDYSLLSFTDEPTGLAYNATLDRLYITDDDNYAVYWVDPDNPTIKLGQFLTQPLGAIDPEDIAVDPDNGRLFIVNGLDRRIIETDATGSTVFSNIQLSTLIADPEALAYDNVNDVFYVGGGFSSNFWVVDRSGNIIREFDIFDDYRNPVNDSRVHVKDLEIAPTSDPNDAATEMSLYVLDYGNSHVNDGRIFEVRLSDPLLF